MTQPRFTAFTAPLINNRSTNSRGIRWCFQSVSICLLRRFVAFCSALAFQTYRSIIFFQYRDVINRCLYCIVLKGVAEVINRLDNKPFDENDETLFEVCEKAVNVFCGRILRVWAATALIYSTVTVRHEVEHYARVGENMANS
jgi:hypothetical protein